MSRLSGITYKAVALLCLRVPVGMGWLGAPLIKKRLRTVQKIEARNMRELCGVGSRGRSPQKGLCFSMQKQHFQRRLHRLRKIFDMGGGTQTTASEASIPSAIRGIHGGPWAGPLVGVARGQRPLD